MWMILALCGVELTISEDCPEPAGLHGSDSGVRDSVK
jgi:hypothetical protein